MAIDEDMKATKARLSRIVDEFYASKAEYERFLKEMELVRAINKGGLPEAIVEAFGLSSTPPNGRGPIVVQITSSLIANRFPKIQKIDTINALVDFAYDAWISFTLFFLWKAGKFDKYLKGGDSGNRVQ